MNQPFMPFIDSQKPLPEYNLFCHFVLKEILNIITEEYSDEIDYIRLLNQQKKQQDYLSKIEQGIAALEICPTNYFQHYLSNILRVKSNY